VVEYNDYRITIKPSGSIGTPWQSDTVFGHLIWLVAMQEGNKAVKNLLKPFLDSDPPFILSDGFPGDCMPSPLFDSDNIASVVQSLEDYARYKKNKNSRFITADSFHRIRKENIIRSGFINEPYTTVETIHASLNRNTNSTGDEGQLFSTHDTFLKSYDIISIYVRCKRGEDIRIRELFERLSLTGYGRDKSTGTGAFKVINMESFDEFDTFKGANGFISLSTLVPAEDDPTEGRWRLRVKRGFLGEQAGNGNPFKRPLIQFEPGAVFKTVSTPNPWYGRMITDIAPGMSKAVQNCMTLAVPCKF